MQIERLLRSSPFRLAVGYAVLFGASALILLAFVYWSTAGFVLRQADQTIEAEVAGLAERYRVGGLRGLSLLIEERLSRQPAGSSLYLVADASYRPLVGNLSAWPRVQPDDEGWLDFRLDGQAGEAVHWARARPFRLQGGFHLLAGRDMYELQAMRTTIFRTLLWGVALTALLALSGGVLIGRGRIRRVAEISRAMEDVVAGDLGRRIESEPADDDIEQLVANLNRMLSELEKQVDTVRRVSDNIAHDLRTPLARLKNQLEMLLLQEPEGRREMVEKAVADADGLLATFNALLRIARIEAGRRGQALAAVELEQLVGDVVELYAPSFEEAGVRLVHDCEPGLVASADRDLLFQALANLLDNALKHAVPEATCVRIETSSAGDGVRLSVADDGPGVPAAERERVVERFYRLDASRSTPGAGLGLSLVAAVADLHGSPLELSDEGPGLLATLRLRQARS